MENLSTPEELFEQETDQLVLAAVIEVTKYSIDPDPPETVPINLVTPRLKNIFGYITNREEALYMSREVVDKLYNSYNDEELIAHRQIQHKPPNEIWTFWLMSSPDSGDFYVIIIASDETVKDQIIPQAFISQELPDEMLGPNPPVTLDKLRKIRRKWAKKFKRGVNSNPGGHKIWPDKKSD